MHATTGGLDLRVLDLADVSGVFCTRLLVGLGAEVIRIEPPGGDPLRARDALAFAHWNAGKRSVTVDLEAPGDAARFLRLAAGADVVVETFPPGQLDALGLGWPTLRAVNPALVLVSVTPFGQTGPRAAWRGTNLTLSALGGMTWLSGPPDGPPLNPPREQAYHLAGVNAAIGTLLALRGRRITGRGQHVEVSVQEAVAATLEYGALRYIHEGVVHCRTGHRYPHVPHGVFPARDGFVAGGFGGSSRMWDGLLAWLREAGQAGDLDQPRFADETVRLAERAHVFSIIEAFTRGFGKAEFCQEAQRRRLPWAPVDSAVDLASSAQLEARGFFIDVDLGMWVARDLGFAFAFPDGRRPTRLRVPVYDEARAELLSAEPRASREVTTAIGALAETAARTRGALAGTRLLDLTWVLAGPYATRILADHGAEVIKIESRHRPDPSRFTAALHLSRDPARHPDTSGYFNNVNRNKLGLVLNLGRPEGFDLLRRLVAQCDVVVENFSARVMASWGLDFASLSAIRPEIILVSMAGMGHTGPYRDHVTYADAVQALAGIAAEVGLPGGEPLGLTFGLGDMIAGCHAALATLAALEYRNATGRGQHVDLSQVEAVASQMGTALLELTRDGTLLGPRGNRDPAMAPHGVFPCRGEDRWCAIAVGSDAQWRALCRVLGHPATADDPRFASGAARKTHEDTLEGLVAGWTRDEGAPALVERLQAAGVPAGMVQDGRDLLNDPQLRARGFYVTLTHPRAGAFPHEGVVTRLSETPGGVRAPAPCLGEHTDEVLGRLLGLDTATIERYRKAGILE
jgi:crotonobetainyl-CoA:carnitine CoA-transferase CaiB-like acyl-CoA transferase